VLPQLKRCDISAQRATTDAATARRQYQEAVEESGRLEARIQAFTFSAQTEQSQLISELRGREDALRKLRTQQVTLQETISRQQEQVGGQLNTHLRYDTVFNMQ